MLPVKILKTEYKKKFKCLTNIFITYLAPGIPLGCSKKIGPAIWLGVAEQRPLLYKLSVHFLKAYSPYLCNLMV